MKKLLTILAILFLISFFFIPSAHSYTTSLRVKNSNSSPVVVYLTLSAGQGWISNVNNIFGIVSTNKTQGAFVLQSGDSATYTPPTGIGLSGNIAFGAAPVNCPKGVTVYEFTLNNYGTVKYAQETVEISCVPGVSSLGRISMYGGGDWSATTAHPKVTQIQNDSLGKNSGLVGIYPFGCTGCTDTIGKPTCVKTPETPQSAAICNVQRFAKYSGGTVKIEFLGFTE